MIQLSIVSLPSQLLANAAWRLLENLVTTTGARERLGTPLVPDETICLLGDHNNENGVGAHDVPACYRLFPSRYPAGLDCQRAGNYSQSLRDRCPRQNLKIRDLVQLPRPQRDSKTIHCRRRAKAERALRR